MHKKLIDKEITNTEYLNWWAQKRGYKNHAEYNIFSVQNRGYKNTYEYQKQGRIDNPEYKECQKQYYQDNKKDISKKQKQYYQSHKEQVVGVARRYLQTPEGKKLHRKSSTAYQKTPAGKLVSKKASSKYFKTPNGKLASKKHAHKHRGLGHIVLNESDMLKPGYEEHHMSWEYVLYVPKWLNHICYHNVKKNINMKKVNTIAIEWYNLGWI